MNCTGNNHPQPFVFRPFSPVCSSCTRFPRWLCCRPVEGCWQTTLTSDTRKILYKVLSAPLLALKGNCVVHIYLQVLHENIWEKKRGQKFKSDKLKTEGDFNRGVISPVVSPISSFFLPVIGFARRSYVYEIKNHTWTLQFHPDRPGDDASCDSTPTQHNKTCCNLPTEKISSYNFEFIVALPLCSHFCKSPPSLFIRFTDKSKVRLTLLFLLL